MSPVHTEEALHDYLVVANDNSILPLGDQYICHIMVTPYIEMSLVTGDKIKLT